MTETLPFFPAPHPDELFYGTCARFHVNNGSPAHRSTMEDLFGDHSACAVFDLPTHLGYLNSRLSLGTLNSVERIIDGHTMLPLYRPFLPKRRVERLTSWMKASDRGGSIHMSAGVMASSVPSPRFLRYCLECHSFDEKEVGEAYWHRSHQIAGVRMCHIHGCWLWESDIPATMQQDKHYFHPVPERDDLCQGKSLQLDCHEAQFYKISTSVAWLLRAPSILIPGLSSLQKRYIHHLKELDLVSCAGRIRQKEFLGRFVSYYGSDVLKALSCEIDRHAADNWLSKLVRKPRKATHPLHHVLLIHFLGLEPAQFFGTIPGKMLDFGRGPWPCLNPVADHYLQPVIRSCAITRNSENGKPTGNFFCSCGFCYARTGPDRDKTDRYRIGRMIQFGQVWEQALQDFWVHQGKGLRETSRLLGVDPHTVKHHLAHMHPTGGERASDASEDHVRADRRLRWSELRGSFPTAGRKALRMYAPAEYAWLYRHDREWLQENLPPLTPHRNGIVATKWLQRDWRLAAEVLEAASAIHNRQGRPVRITISSIGKTSGELALLQKRLGRLPLTKSRLEKVCEAQDEFNIRRVRSAVDRLLAKSESLQEWRIVREARMRPGYSQKVATEIQRMIIRTYKGAGSSLPAEGD